MWKDIVNGRAGGATRDEVNGLVDCTAEHAASFATTRANISRNDPAA